MATIGELTAKLGLDSSDFTKGIQESTGQLDQLGKTIKEGTQKLQDLGKSLKDKAAAMSSSVKATYEANKALTASQLAWKGATLATNAFKVALASTGIGLIVVALGSLIAYLTTTQAGMDKLRQVTEPVAEVFRRLLGVLQDLGGNVFKGIAQILNGDVRAGFKTLADGATEAGRATVSAFKDGVSAGRELARLQVEIEEAQNDFILVQARVNQEIAKQREIASDANRTESERQLAAQRAVELIDERVRAEDKVLALQEKRLRLSQESNDTDRAGFRELNELIAQRMNLETQASTERRRLLGLANKELGFEIEQTKNLIALQREQLGLFLQMTKGLGQGARRDPFNLETAPKYSKETLENITKISNTLINPNLKTGRLTFTPEQIESVRNMNRAFEENRKSIEMTGFLVQNLGQVFQGAFQAMLMSGELTFKGLIRGLKAMIAQLVAAAAAAFALNLLLGGIPSLKGLGGKEGFKNLFSAFSGLPRFAEGGMVTGLTTAVLGDNPSGKEAVIPFEKMGSFLSQFGGGGNQRVEVVGVLRGEDIVLSSSNYQAGRQRRLF